MGSPTEIRQFKYLGAITVLYVAMQLISDVTAGKIVEIGPFPVSVTVLYFPITFIFADVLTEVYGYAAGRRVLWNVILCSFIAGVIYQIVVFLPPAPGFKANDAYAVVLGQVPRVLVGSWIAVFVGEILNIASIAGQIGSSDAIYGVSKSGVLGLTKTSAMALAPHIRVNAVAPTLVETELLKSVSKERIETFRKGELIKTPVQLEDIADTVWFLLSDQSSHFTGAVLDINNGFLLR